MTSAVERRAPVTLAALALAVLSGYAVVRQPLVALLLAGSVVVVVALVLLGVRAYPWALVLIAVTPWYPFLSDYAGPPLVPQLVLCSAIIAAPLIPWVWALGSGSSRGRPSARVGLYGLTFVGLTIAIYETLGSISPMLESATVGLLVGGLAFVAARQFPDARAWGAAAALGVTALIGMGLLAYASAPGARVGAFTGYPITYGALLVGLLPMALVWASRRSTALTAVMGTATCALLVLSESRSSWIAFVVVLMIVVGLLFRQRRWRALRAVGGLALMASVLIAATGSLSGIVERKLSPEVRQSDSVTHRAWSYGYAVSEIRERPFFGAGAPGYAATQAAAETDIGAIDNGYLSVAVDSGLFGLAAVIVPIAIAALLATRWFWRRSEPAPEVVALALGVLAVAIVTVFYDTFYWAQLSLLLFAMGGALSAQPHQSMRAPRRLRPAHPPGQGLQIARDYS